MLGHLVLSQDPSLKRWDTSHCPKTLRPSVGTLRAVPGPLVVVLGHFALSHDLVLEHFVLSQDLSLKCWDTSHCPKTSHSNVGTLRTVPRLPAQVLGHLVLSQDPSLKRWTLRTVLRPPTQVLGHLALSQDPSLKCWVTTPHCPRTSHSSVGTLRTSQDHSSKCWDTSYCPRTSHPSVWTLRTVP